MSKNSNNLKASMQMLGLLFMVAIFASCAKNENDCDPDDIESACYTGPAGAGKLLLAEAKTNGKTSAVYEYDSQNRPTVIHTYNAEGTRELTTTYTYTNADFPAVVTGKNKNGAVAVEEYTFGNDGRPVTMVQTVSDESGVLTQNYQFSYSDSKLIETIVAVTDNPTTYVNTYTYDDNGNLLSIVYQVDGQWWATVEQSNYDDKIGVGTNGNPLAWKFPGVNNHQAVKSSSALVGSVTNDIWKYTYNDAGYPLTAEIYSAVNGILIATHAYSYIPAK